MNDDLTRESVTALRTAAERLGVDPFRLARFLANGRLSEILEMMGRPARDTPRGVQLMEEYLAFLDREIAHQEGTQPTNGNKRNGS